jgi:hypothetical protein
LQQLLEFANANEWQRCYSCKTIVELDTGCNHMTYVTTSLTLALVLNPELDADAEPSSAMSVE